MHADLATRRGRWHARLLLLPVILALCLILPKLHQGRFNVDTGWYAAIALQAWRSAAETGDWSHLWTLRGYGGGDADALLYFNKPPLAFWIHGLFLWALGPTGLAARLPSAIAAAWTVLFTVGAASRLGGRRTALLAGIVLALTVEFTRHARAFSLDLWQAMFFMAAAHLAAGAVAGGRPRRLAWVGVPIGLALMTKPLVGLVPLGILAGWLVWTGRWRWCGWLAVAAAVAAAVALPWHLSMALTHGEAFTSAYFGREIAGRAAGSIEGLNDAAAGPLYYLAELPRQYWPWLVTAALAHLAWARAMVGPRAAAGAPGGRWRGDGMKLAVHWTIVWLALLSIFPDKRPRYLLPLYPMWAWMSAAWLLGDAPRWAAHARRAMERWAAPVLVAAAALITVLPVRLERVREEHYEALFAAMEGLGAERLWEGGRPDGARGARVYLRTGHWPRRARDQAGEVVAEPPAGALVMYHEMDGWGPGEGETVVMQRGPITLSRVGQAGWRPMLTAAGRQ